MKLVFNKFVLIMISLVISNNSIKINKDNDDNSDIKVIIALKIAPYKPRRN